MKLIGFALLAAAAGILLWVGVSASRAEYVPPRAPGEVPRALSGEIPAGYEVQTFEVQGMCCPNCSAKLYQALIAVQGVRAAAVDPTLGQAEALVATGTPSADLAHALTFDKYAATLRP
jgi:copper chaperone CopZ